MKWLKLKISDVIFILFALAGIALVISYFVEIL
jgi:hypothetical protein